LKRSGVCPMPPHNAWHLEIRIEEFSAAKPANAQLSPAPIFLP